MRHLRKTKGPAFKLWHLTYNRKTGETKGLRFVEYCRLRVSLPGEKFEVNADLYLPYIDLSLPQNDQNRVCRKHLVRYVAFPPDFKKLKVNWFTS